MKRQGKKPVLTFGPATVAGPGGFHRDLPFRRSWIAILILAAMDIVFLLPAIATFGEAASEWARQESLFDLVAAIFLSAWLLGWMTAPVLMTGILVLMLFGRETLVAKPGNVEIRMGIPWVGLSAKYRSSAISNLRYVKPVGKSPTSWRGNHMVFDYGPDSIAVGSNIAVEEFEQLRSMLREATGSRMRRGDTPAESVETAIDPANTAALNVTADEAAARDLTQQPLSLTSASSLLLIFANLAPIAGSMFFSWKLSDIMVLYWAESAIIGLFNVCKIITINRVGALLAAPFFVAHFGAFMAVHFLFLYTIFVEPDQAGVAGTGDLTMVAAVFIALWPAFLGLFLSHAFSFFQNFLGRREYLNRTVDQQMTEPYSRIIFMHVALILGGGLSMVLGGSTLVLLVIIVFKIVFDVKAHLKQHSV